jgi:hypothetical protein
VLYGDDEFPMTPVSRVVFDEVRAPGRQTEIADQSARLLADDQ